MVFQKENISVVGPDWEGFAVEYAMSQEQLDKFKKYVELLISWNKKFNLTAILDETDIVNYHLKDSLSLGGFIDLKGKVVADIGTGGGFPGLPLKIANPDINLILIEVNGKKIKFLQHVVDELGLQNVQIEQVDWRTFLRSNDYPIDIFCARASLQLPELLRVFKPSSAYGKSELVYWASDYWKPREQEEKYIAKEFEYLVGSKKRRLVLFKNIN